MKRKLKNNNLSQSSNLWPFSAMPTVKKSQAAAGNNE
jgi:hypothetical protein